MKTNVLNSTLALLALCSAITLSAATRPTALRRSPTGITVASAKSDPLDNGETVTVGANRKKVEQLLGPADNVLTDGSWLYDRFLAESNDDQFSEPGTLVVRFTADKVSALTLANGAEVTALRSALRRRTADQLHAADQQR